MSKVAIGLGAALALVVVIFLIIELTGEETPVDESLGGSPPEEISLPVDVPTPPPPPPDAPPCSEYVCEDNYDNKEGNGETSGECCEKKLCTELSTPPLCPEGQELDQFTRGDTVGECCKIPYCESSECVEPGTTLRGDSIRGTTPRSSSCCRDLPNCGGYTCPPGTDKKPDPTSIYGETSEECCNLKTCTENAWTTKCEGPLAPGMTWDPNNADLPGNTKEECCAQGSCFDNDWTGADGDLKCQSSFLGGNEGNSAIMGHSAVGSHLGVIYGNSVPECCAMKKCSENGWDTKCAATRPPQKMKNNGNDQGNTEEICCEDKTYSDWAAEPANGCSIEKKPVSEETVCHNEDTCCTPKTCSEIYGSQNPCTAAHSSYSPNEVAGDGVIAIPGVGDPNPADSANENPFCCPVKKCTDPSEGLNTKAKCNDKDNPLVNIPGETIINGVSLYDVVANPGSEDLGWSTCCEPKATCKDVYPDDTKCPGSTKPDTTEENTVIDSPADVAGRGNVTEPTAALQCCQNKKCSEETVICPDQWEPDTNKNNEEYKNPTEDPGQCCSLKTCAANGWDDAKCKDKEYTAANNRGKLKSAGKGYGPTHASSTTGVEYDDNGVAATRVNGGLRSDERCCEQDLKKNWARTCVHNEINKNNVVHRKSTGAIAFWGAEANSSNVAVPGTSVVGTAIETNVLGKNATTCKEKCEESHTTDPEAGCNTFWLQINGQALTGRCDTLPGFNNSTSTVRTSGSPNAPLEWEYFAPIEGGGHTYTQYYNGRAFPPDKRYSGGNHASQKDFGKKEGCKTATNGHGANPKGYTPGAGNQCQQSSGGSPTLHEDMVEGSHDDQKAAAIAAGVPDYYANSWSKRREILLAGVDEEFCPFHFIDSYGHTSNTYSATKGSVYPAQPGGSEPTSGNFSRTEHGAYPEWTAGCVTNRRLGDHYDGCWDDKNCRKFMTHVHGAHADICTQTKFAQVANIQQYCAVRAEDRRACVKNHVGSNTTTQNDGRTGHTLIKSIHIDATKPAGEKFIHGVLPPKAAVAPTPNGMPSWGVVPSKMLIPGDTGV